MCGDIPGRQDLTKDDIGCIMVKCTSYDFWRSSSDHKFSLFVSTAPILTILFQSVCDVSYTTLYRCDIKLLGCDFKIIIFVAISALLDSNSWREGQVI